MSRRGKLLIVVVAAGVGLVGLLGAITFAMLFVGDPVFGPQPVLSPEAMAELAARYAHPYPAEPRQFTLRDGGHLHAEVLPGDGDTTVVLAHGALATGQLLNRPAGLLRESLAASVIAVDLRGHGGSSGAPGDIDYIGQYEDDLADVVAALRRAKPGGRIILAGHSMGGGIALRYAERVAARAATPVDAYLLFAPHMGYSSPTNRTSPAKDGPEMVKVHIARTLCLALFNWIGITGLNGMQTLFFNLPPEFPLRSYSFRAMVGGAPEEYRDALAAAEAPLLVLVGSEDEAFHADRFDAALRPYAHAELANIEGATHDSVLVDPRALAAARSWALRSAVGSQDGHPAPDRDVD